MGAPKPRTILVLSILVALLAFLVLHDATYGHGTEQSASHHGVVEDHGEAHAAALCALLLVGTSLSLFRRTLAKTPRQAPAFRRNVSVRSGFVESWSSPGGLRPCFDFCPILA